MWPGEQPSTGGPDPRQHPYPQPGHQQAPYRAGQQQPAPWDLPTLTAPPPPGGGPSRRTTALVVSVAAAVVVAASVTGAVLLRGGGDDRAAPGPAASSASAPAASPAVTDPGRGAGGPVPTVDGWNVVTNSGQGIAFDVPATWKRQAPDWITWVTEDDDPEATPLVAMKAPAVLKEKWCSSDDDRNGTLDDTALGTAGTRGHKGARGTEEIARKDSADWVYGAFAQPARDKVTTGPSRPPRTTGRWPGCR